MYIFITDGQTLTDKFIFFFKNLTPTLKQLKGMKIEERNPKSFDTYNCNQVTSKSLLFPLVHHSNLGFLQPYRYR